MSQGLPPRANLTHLKKQCKQRVRALRAAGRLVQLTTVQRDMARHYGFPSWAKLRAHFAVPPPASSAMAPDQHNAFLDAIVWPADLGTRATAEALALYRRSGAAGAASIFAAAATGDPAALRDWLQRDPTSATRPGGPRQWMPLSYLCFSRLLTAERSPRRRQDFARCARMLLEAGADPNTAFTNPGDQVRESALYGAAGIANDPAVTRVLLEGGADVDDGETLYHAAEFTEHACLALILQRRPKNVSFCLCHMMDHEDAPGVQLFLDHGADPNFMIRRAAPELVGLRPLHFAILRQRSPKVVRMLLRGGADPSLPSAAGLSPYAFALRLGRKSLARVLQNSAAADELPAPLRFLAACSAGQAREARALLAADPRLLQDLSPADAALLPQAAAEGRLAAVRLMLDVGFPIDAAGNWGGTALHQAAWSGRPSIVRLLLKRGARVDIRQGFGGDVMQTAIHGALHGNHVHGAVIIRLLAPCLPPGDWQQYLAMARAERAGDILAVLEQLAPASPGVFL